MINKIHIFVMIDHIIDVFLKHEMIRENKYFVEAFDDILSSPSHPDALKDLYYRNDFYK
jgi:hypothetical protein